MSTFGQPSPFSEAWEHLSGTGLACIPLTGKKPLVRGFRSWRRPRSKTTLSNWAKAFPLADIGILPGLSCIDGVRLVIIDADDSRAGDQISDLFGDTPVKVKTRRGLHFYYKVKESLPKTTSLRAFGINGDVKSGNSFVVAPPSQHAEDGTFVYSWYECCPMQIADAPLFPVAALLRLMEGTKAQLTTGGRVRFRDDSRGLGMNDYLASRGPLCVTGEEVEAVAIDFNARLRAQGHTPLRLSEVRQRAASVWEDVQRGRLVPMGDGEASAVIRQREFDNLIGDRHGEAALVLLALLRFKHGARAGRGEAFAISARAMEQSNVISRWSARKYRNARNLLVDKGILILIEEADLGRAAQFSFAPSSRRVSASET